MRLATFTHGGTTRAGVVVDDEVVDLGPSEMTALLAAGLERVAEAAARARARAAEAIAGWVVLNDVSVRDWQLRVPTWTMGKSFDTHGPMGPWIVTADELGDPHALRLRTWVNGELRQDSSTAQLIFDSFALVEHLSTASTLEPGDVVATGTPGGVGMAMSPPRFLVPGDVVRVEIERIGHIENRVVDEPDDTARL